ncbi:hypothetical protein [Arthrospira platensis]|jgi:hypothetical protein|uniref:Uncharacterized protein n=1 Tax=Limnospira platensis NIES-46 TaxID=1236695 RepID=A0A5M3T3T6_LIMPL|nr:hypothetical protein [Arthrospira platensis]AMW26886.1 hypothetical protein AP285_01610 [Arthrospira platensis YZ]MBD2670226.1 hypothetical protein [Arthrospira platensis FACHB-439]MBD2710859.1 hypothetical protein [Arthrospira platensis FACHB-835]MDF2211729.1 hypothetical protein [Arthrospira platensis NCB002]QQW29635.1 hypothetical protein AP9108_01670 [Arthrospira sp. PCC 9108]BAI88222.1 hypothetical protein NIES39_A03840 [Arthrospira platensis NIES-39]
MTSFWKNLFRQELPVLNVTMLGPGGVGKTSLLAAMYDQFDNVSQDLQLRAEEQSKSELKTRLKELKSMVESSRSIKVKDGVSGTKGEPRSFKFEFGQTGTAPALEINFQDYPGGWLEGDEHKKQVKALIRDSVAVLIPINTPPLMEREGKYHEKFNQPTQLNDLFKTIYKDLDSPRLVILAPVKCEKYMNNPPELFKEVREGYKQMLNQFASEKLLPKVAVVITPVQTVGSVVFSRVEEIDDQPIFYYRKPQPSDPYQPKNTEVPLRYLLRFLLKLHLDTRRASIFTRIQDSFGRNVGLQNAVSRFAEPRTDEADIIQGIEWLKL